MAAMLTGVAAFAFMDAGLKLLTAHYPSAQVAALRGLAALPVVFVWAMYAGGARQLVRVRWPLHLVRGVLSVFMMITFTFALKELSLAKTYALFFVAPLLIAILSVFMLGERVSRAQWVAIVVGFVGRADRAAARGARVRLAGTLAVLGTALCYALSSILVKIIGRTDSTQSMVFWMTCMLAIGATALALPEWQPILREHYLIIGGVAFTGAVGQWGITEAFKRAPAASVAPLEYSGPGLGDHDRLRLSGRSMPDMAHAGGRGGDHRQRAVPAAFRVAPQDKLGAGHISSRPNPSARGRFGNTSPHGDRDRAENPAADHGHGALRALQFSLQDAESLLTVYMTELPPFIIHFHRLRWHRVHAALRSAPRCSRRAARWRWPRWSTRRRSCTTSRAERARRSRPRAASLPHLSRRRRLPRSVRAVGVLERRRQDVAHVRLVRQRRAAAAAIARR